MTDLNVEFTQLDLMKYLVTFKKTDKNTPDLIAWELKQPKYKGIVSFVETKTVTKIGEDSIEMIILVESSLTDVAELIKNASKDSANGWRKIQFNFMTAYK